MRAVTIMVATGELEELPLRLEAHQVLLSSKPPSLQGSDLGTAEWAERLNYFLVLFIFFSGFRREVTKLCAEGCGRPAAAAASRQNWYYCGALRRKFKFSCTKSFVWLVQVVGQ